MIQLSEAIFSRYTSDAGAKLKALLGKSGEMSGMYLGAAPESAPFPFVVFFFPADGSVSPSFPEQKATTLERSGVQFSIFAETQTKVMQIAGELKDLYDRWEGPIGPEEAPVGAIVSSRRQGPGFFVPDPEAGYDGHIQYTFTYWVS